MTIRPALFSFVFAARMFAGDGVHPLPNASDYPVHQDLKNAALSATIVPPDQVRKMFSTEVARDWIVVEVAVYPGDGKSFDVDNYDFNLKVADRMSRSENAVDVAGIGAPHGPDNRGPEPKVHVSEEAGVAIGHTNYPQGNPQGQGYPQGQPAPRTTVGTWESTTVSNSPTGPPPASPSGRDPRELAAALRDKQLPDGITQKPVAGYLYFRQVKHKKSDPLVLQYTKGEVEADLKLPVK